VSRVVFYLVLVSGVCVLVAQLEERSRSEYCLQCGTDRSHQEYRFAGFSFRATSQTRVSRVARDLLAPRHEHSWRYGGGSWCSLLGSAGVG